MAVVKLCKESQDRKPISLNYSQEKMTNIVNGKVHYHFSMYWAKYWTMMRAVLSFRGRAMAGLPSDILVTSDDEEVHGLDLKRRGLKPRE